VTFQRNKTQASCESQIRAQHAVSLVLDATSTIDDAAPAIVQSMAESNHWRVTELWIADTPSSSGMRLVGRWDRESGAFSRPIDTYDEARPLQTAMGSEAECRLNITSETSVDGSAAFPIKKGERVYGLQQYFGPAAYVQETHLRLMADQIGIAVRQFMDRKETEAKLMAVHSDNSEEVRLAERARGLGDIAHDISNMLMPVISGAKLLEEVLVEEELDVHRRELSHPVANRHITKELLDMIQRGSAQVRDRVREFVGSVKEQRAPAQFRPCRFEQVVANVYVLLGLSAEQQGITLQTQSLDTLPLIQGDERQLFSMVYNLVHNAIPEVCPNGSITIKGRLQEDGQRILVSVIDTGKGMSPEVKASLFTPQAVSRKAGGTGLGTKIVKDVVDAHGGQITVESKAGAGTSFHILLPVTQPA
jgi:signal transduction histidine kinase